MLESTKAGALDKLCGGAAMSASAPSLQALAQAVGELPIAFRKPPTGRHVSGRVWLGMIESAFLA